MKCEAEQYENSCATIMSQLSCEAYAIEERNYRLHRIFLKSLGLWPYQQSFFWKLQKILFSTILISFILVQLLSFVTMQFNRDLFLKVFWSVFASIFCTTKYCIFAIQADTVKKMMEQIRNNWSLLKSKSEIDIVEKYAYNLKLLITIVIVSFLMVVFCILIFQIWPLIFDVILPLNESRSFKLLVSAEYFANQRKYVHVILLHEMTAIYISFIGMCSVALTMAIFLRHSCVLLKIASYRMENMFEINKLTNPKREYIFSQRIANVVSVHQKAIEFTDSFMSNFSVLYIILIATGVLSLSFSLFQLLHLMSTMNDIILIIINVLWTAAHFAYMFIANYFGQEVTNHGVNFFTATYNGLWYTASVQSQKLILFLMQKGVKDIIVTAGVIYEASMANCATLTNMAVSYFMLLYQTQ